MAERIGLEAVLEIGPFRRGLDKYLGGIGRMEKATAGASRSLGGQFVALGDSVLGFGLKAAKVAAGGIATLATALVGLGVISVKTAASFESAFVGVAKTTDGLIDDAGQITAAGIQVRDGLRDLAKEIPVTFEELGGIAEIGGQLGISESQLVSFTNTVAALGVSTNLSQEEAATSLARISNIFGISANEMGGNIEHLGSTIVALGNKFPATETEIASFAIRLASAGSVAGLSQQNVLAIGTAMTAVGVQAERGGTAVQKVLLAMDEAVAGSTTGFVDNTEKIDDNTNKLLDLNAQLVTLEAQTGTTGAELWNQFEAFKAAGGSAEEFGRQLGDTRRAQLFKTTRSILETNAALETLRASQGKPIKPEALEGFAKVAGVSADKFKKMWKEDAAGAFQAFVEGLGEAENAAVILEDLELGDERLKGAFLALAGAGGLLGDTINEANIAWDENSALTNEAKKRYQTFESQVKILKNQLRDIAFIVGTPLLEFLKNLIQKARPLIEEFAKKLPGAIEKFIDKIKELIASFQKGGFKGLAEALGLSPKAISTIQAAAQNIVKVINFIRENWETFRAALIGIGSVLAIAATVAAITAAIALITNPITLIIAAGAALAAAWQTNFLGIRDILTNFWETTARPILEQLVSWLQFNIPIAIEALSIFWQTTLLPALQTVWNFILTGVIPVLSDLWAWLAVNVPIAIQALSTFWQTTLLPALQTVRDFIVNSVVPALSDIWTWLSTNIPAAIQMVSDFWRGTLLPALQAVSDFITMTLIPTFMNIWDWINNRISAAIQVGSTVWTTYMTIIQGIGDFIGQFIIPILVSMGAVLLELGRIISDVVNLAVNSLAILWTETLLPALQAVWGFISESILPIFQGVGDKTNQVVTPAILEWSRVWNDVLLPAMKSVWAFIKENILTILEELRKFIAEEVGPAIKDFTTNVVEKLTDAFDGLKKILVKVRDFLDNIRDALAKIKIPEQLQSKSPSPFEVGLRGVADAMDEISRRAAPNLARALALSAPDVTQQVAVQPFAAATPFQLPPIAPAGGGGLTVNIGPVTIASDMDMAVFETRVKRIVAEAA